jgi:hypothetical protein
MGARCGFFRHDFRGKCGDFRHGSNPPIASLKQSAAVNGSTGSDVAGRSRVALGRMLRRRLWRQAERLYCGAPQHDGGQKDA